MQVYSYNSRGKPLQLKQKCHYYPFDSNGDIGGQKYFARFVADDNQPCVPDDPKAPTDSLSSFVLLKCMGAEVGGRCPVDGDAKLEGKDAFHPGTFYNPQAPQLATAGPDERAADEMQR